MSINGFSILSSAVHITEERDKRSLEKILSVTLSDFIRFDSLILLRTTNESGFLDVALSRPIDEYKTKYQGEELRYGEPRIVVDEMLVNCIENNQMLEVATVDQKTRTVFPIEVLDKVVGALDIYGDKLEENSIKIVEGFLAIYQNFLSLLYDNEHDALTGLLNRKTFELSLSRLVESANEMIEGEYSGNNLRNLESENSHTMGVLDIDHFKRINDEFGHVYGDEVLLLFSDIMRNTFRESDLMFRFGGEEFVVVLMHTTLEEAESVFERFRVSLENYEFPQVGQVTASIGIAKISKEAHSTTLLESADRALYYAKENGRNQIQNYHTLLSEGKLKERVNNDDIELF